MNALLRLMFYLEQNCNTLPDDDALLPHLQKEQASMREALLDLAVRDEIAPGYRQDRRIINVVITNSYS